MSAFPAPDPLLLAAHALADAEESLDGLPLTADARVAHARVLAMTNACQLAMRGIPELTDAQRAGFVTRALELQEQAIALRQELAESTVMRRR